MLTAQMAICTENLVIGWEKKIRVLQPGFSSEIRVFCFPAGVFAGHSC